MDKKIKYNPRKNELSGVYSSRHAKAFIGIRSQN